MIDNWRGCYDSGWNGEIVPEAFAHPAKVSRGLIRLIYAHAFYERWLLASHTVVDPFGGIGGTALDAMWHGLNWIGIELEPRFVDLAGQNLALWHRKYSSKAGWGTARIIQGDSRRLGSLINQTEMVVGSPPFLKTLAGREEFDRQRAAQPNSSRFGRQSFQGTGKIYGSSPGNLGNMPMGDLAEVIGKADCLVSSPPFLGVLNASKTKIPHDTTGNFTTDYGITPGQLGAMAEGRFDAVVSSPPFIEASKGGGISASMRDEGTYKLTTKLPANCYQPAEQGTAEGNLAAQKPENFWIAAAEIVAQCYQILRPGGHAIWVCKNFIRAGKVVQFSDQWLALCESQGFILTCRHRAMLTTEHGTQSDIFGGEKRLVTARKSFFRRLCESKGAPAIDWEDVLCLIKNNELDAAKKARG